MGRIPHMIRNMGMLLWTAWSSTCPSLPFHRTTSLIKKAHTVCEHRLQTMPPDCLEYGQLIQNHYMKEKHWVYAVLMATMESLPVLYRICTDQEKCNAVLAKTYLGASSKLLDNLNDEIHTVKEALNSLRNYLQALQYNSYEGKGDSSVHQAESSACEMASWIGESLDEDAPAFPWYIRDCRTLVEGQISSLEHKVAVWPSLSEYVQSIAEKSIGDVWIDIDLCQVQDITDDILLLKKSNEYVFKSSLLYDDVQDLEEDIENRAVNAVIILGLEREIITEEELTTVKPAELVDILKTHRITDDIIHLADALFLKGIFTFMDTESCMIDKKGLLKSFILVRLFNFRKLLLQNKDVATLRKVLTSFSDPRTLEAQIPEEMKALVW